MDSKSEKYKALMPRIRGLVAASDDLIADMANVAAVLHRELGFWWTGFYRVCGGELVLGPFQGPEACTRIAYGKGVCGTAWQRGGTVVVPDVERFPGHIACSAESRSEIVVPVWERGRITAVLDIDSRERGAFDETDREYLESVCAELSCRIRPELQDYVQSRILPLYDGFDAGHGRDHALTVIDQALRLCVRYDVDPDLVYAAAAFHDTGLTEDRKTHHLVSGRIIRSDAFLKGIFRPEEIETIAQAAEDHRASLDHEPRTVYGRLIAEADRQIIPETVILRCIQYGLAHYPELDREGHWRRTVEHLNEKYAEGGYLRLWIPESPNAARMVELREIIKDEKRLREYFDRYYPTI